MVKRKSSIRSVGVLCPYCTYNCITIFRLNIEGWCTLYTSTQYTSVQFYRLIVHCSFCTLFSSSSFRVLTNGTIPLKWLIPGYCYSRGNFRFSALMLFYILEYICIIFIFFFGIKLFGLYNCIINMNGRVV